MGIRLLLNTIACLMMVTFPGCKAPAPSSGDTHDPPSPAKDPHSQLGQRRRMVIPQIKGPETRPKRPSSPSKAPLDFQTQLVDAAKRLPANAEVYFAGDPTWLRPKLGSVLSGSGKRLPTRFQQRIVTLRALKSRLGGSYKDARSVAGFISPSRRAIGFVIGAPWPPGLGHSQPIRMPGGLLLLRHRDQLLLGNRAGLRELLAVAAGQLPTWAADQTSRLFRLAHQSAGAASVIVALDLRRMGLRAGVRADYLLLDCAANGSVRVDLRATHAQATALTKIARSYLQTGHFGLGADSTGKLLQALAVPTTAGRHKRSVAPALLPTIALVLATAAAKHLDPIIDAP